MVEVTGKFVSALTAADSVQRLEDTATGEIPFVMPDTSLFNDSLGDDFHTKCLDGILSEPVKPVQNLDDSLCDEETQLPSVEPEHVDVGNIGTEMAECKSRGRNLDDSLCCDTDDEETQCQFAVLNTANENGPLSGRISPTAQDVLTSCLDDSMDMGCNNPSSSIPQAKSEESTEKPMSPRESKSEDNSQDNQSAAASKMVPSFGKKKKGFVPPAVKTPVPGKSTVTKPTPNIAPSFTKTKKSKCKTVKLNAADNCQEQKLCSDANKENSLLGGDTQNPKSSPLKANTSVTTNSKKSAAKASVANSTAGKGTVKQVALEKKSGDSKKLEKEKRKLEKEQKRQEREKKKLEQEEKRAEKERLKEEKRLEQERKEVEREQKKLEKELKKLEKEQKKAQKQQKLTTSGKGSLVQKCSNSQPPFQHNTSSEEDTGKSSENSPTMSDTTEDFGVTSATRSTDKLSATGSTSRPGTTSPDSHCKVAETTNPPDCSSAAPEGIAATGSEACSIEGDKGDHGREGMQVSETVLSSSSGEASAEDIGSSAVSDCNQPDVLLVTSNPCNTGSDGRSKKPSSHPLRKPSVTSKDGKKVLKKVAVKKTNLQLKEPISKKDQESKVAKKQMSSSVMQHKKCHSSNPWPGQGSKDKASKPQLKQVEIKSLPPIPRISASSRKRKAVGADSITSCSESESEPPAPKKPRSMPSNYYGPVWVQCDRSDCQKWRQLRDCLDPSEVPEKWICSMNTEPAYSSCSAAEEQWSEPGESQEFVESPFIPGSLVWAKLEGYPWWPAMVEEDPDEETYYEMGDEDGNEVPVKYHVVFFDTPVCRAWVFSPDVQLFSENSNANEAESVTVAPKHRRTLKEGIKQAKKASKMTVAERLSQLTFVKRFHSRKRKSFADDPVNDNTQHSSSRDRAKLASKSARLSTSKPIKHNRHGNQKQVTSTAESLSIAVEIVPSDKEGGVEKGKLKNGTLSGAPREVEQ